MLQALGAMLPFAVGIATSPFPIVAVVLLTLSSRGKAAGVVFLVVRVLAVLVTAGVAAAVSDLIEQEGGAASPVMAVVRIAVGVTLIVLAVRKWGGRPSADQEPKLPKWMGALDGATPGRSALLSLALSIGNPKELLLNIGAGLAIGNVALPIGPTIGAVAVYTVIACATVAAPVVAVLVAAERVRVPLESSRAWLVRNNAVIMSGILLIIGAVLIGGGIGEL
jgi:threonine/homoserine/homoserine lactone efflux protein